MVKESLRKRTVYEIRKDLLNMRFSKAQKKNFSSAMYRKTRKALAQSLTKLNSQLKKEKEKNI